jgi:hypothetical protein
MWYLYPSLLSLFSLFNISSQFVFHLSHIIFNIKISEFLLKGKQEKMVKVGDSIPSIELQEGQPGNNVDLSKELGSGDGIIIGVPAAFSVSTFFYLLSLFFFAFENGNRERKNECT